MPNGVAPPIIFCYTKNEMTNNKTSITTSATEKKKVNKLFTVNSMDEKKAIANDLLITDRKMQKVLKEKITNLSSPKSKKQAKNIAQTVRIVNGVIPLNKEVKQELRSYFRLTVPVRFQHCFVDWFEDDLVTNKHHLLKEDSIKGNNRQFVQKVLPMLADDENESMSIPGATKLLRTALESGRSNLYQVVGRYIINDLRIGQHDFIGNNTGPYYLFDLVKQGQKPMLDSFCNFYPAAPTENEVFNKKAGHRAALIAVEYNRPGFVETIITHFNINNDEVLKEIKNKLKNKTAIPNSLQSTFASRNI